jgi:alpha-ribazole phosphatase
MPLLIAARHAPTALRPGLCAGRLDSAPVLSPEDAWRALSSSAPPLRGVDRVWSSPLRRCAELADRAAAALGVPSRRDDRLLEVSFGQWEGIAWSEIERAAPEEYRRWLACWETEGCPGGESARQLEARVRSWWEALPPEGIHLLIGHAGVLRALRVIVHGVRWADALSAEVRHLEWIRLGD